MSDAIKHTTPGDKIMAIRNIIETEIFEFDNAQSLREWLNRFEVTDLTAVRFINGEKDSLDFVWEVERLSDGSIVNNISIRS